MRTPVWGIAVAALVVATRSYARSPPPVAPTAADTTPDAAPAPTATTPAPLPSPLDPPAEPPSAELGPLMGRVFAYVRAPLRNAAFEQASSSAWLELRPKMGPSYAKVVVTGDAFAASIGNAPDFRARVREGYVGVGNERVDFRIGQQILPWGNADAINPTDFLGARDYTFFSADPEANRLGVLSARASWTPVKQLGIVLVGTPVAPASTLLVPPAIIPAGVALEPLTHPSASLSHAEEAARVTLSGDSWDFTALGFRGWNHTPEFGLAGVSSDGTVDVSLTQHRYLAGGVEASASVARVVLRVESAYVHTDDGNGMNPLIQPSHWDSVVGLERALFGDHVRIQAQGIVRYHPHYTPPSSTRGPDPTTTAIDVALANANAILESYTTQLRVAASLRVAWSATDDRFGLEAFALANLNDQHDLLARPLAFYRATDALKLELGAEIYAGPRTSPLGALHDFSGALFQATYEF